VDTQSETFMIPFSPKRYIMLGVASLLLSFTMIMSVFVPFPLALAGYLYGRTKGYALMGIIWVFGLLLGLFLLGDITVVIIYSFGLLFAISLIEIIYRNISPIRGITYFGAGIIVTIGMFISLATTVSGKSVREIIYQSIDQSREQINYQKEQLSKSNNKEALSIMAILDNPEAMADTIIKQAPSYLMMSIFVTLWVNMFLILRVVHAVPGRRYEFGLERLLNFKMPDVFIWPVIIALIFALQGTYYDLGSEWFEVIGLTTLKVLGVFYFFQGFGIYMSFLDALGMRGFFRTILVVFTVFVAYWMLALIGVFDMFVNFRKLFLKMNSKGE
jgi:MFS family permease